MSLAGCKGADQDGGSDIGHVAFDRGTLHDLRSINKSVTSVLVGITAGDYNSSNPAHSLLGERLLSEYVFAAAGFADAAFVRC